MKKNWIYIIIAVVAGLLSGYFIFGDADRGESTVSTHDHSTISQGEMWTCSMHPQVMQPEPGDCPICGMDLIPAETGADGLSPAQFRMTENALALANVQTSIVGGTTEDPNATISLSGKISINEEAVAIQASYFDGRIEQLNVNYEGQEVSRGQLLATVYSPELVAAQQELLTAASLKESQPQLYEAVRKKLRLWKLSETQIKKIESSGKVQEYFPVYATVSGTVSEVMSAEGDYVKKGQPVVKVSDLSTVWAKFDAYENQLSQLKTGQNIRIRTNAYPGRTFEEQISFIDPVLDNTTRTVSVRAILSNQSNLFKPGMFLSGEVDMTGDTADDSQIYIPSSAVMWTGERSVVYVKTKKEEPVFEMREVTIGSRNEGRIAIKFGLDPGEEIVTNGTFSIDAAAQLKGKRSMMNKEGGHIMTGHEGHGGEKIPEHSAPMKTSTEKDLGGVLQAGLKKTLQPYLEMKDALVNSDPIGVSKQAETVLKELAEIEETLLNDPEMAYLRDIRERLNSIASSNDLSEQRAGFVVLNENLVPLIGRLKGLDRKLYLQRCPMANENKGAFWLSEEEVIRNPYFGESMLRCGEVTQVFN